MWCPRGVLVIVCALLQGLSPVTALALLRLLNYFLAHWVSGQLARLVNFDQLLHCQGKGRFWFALVLILRGGYGLWSFCS